MCHQWSAAYQDMTQLLGMQLINSIYSVLVSTADGNVDNEQVEIITKVNRILQRDTEWAGSSDGELCRIATEFIRVNNRKTNINGEQITAQFPSWVGKQNIWIIKPVGLSCGENIQVVRGVLQVLSVMRAMNYKCIVQKYIEKPLLVRNSRKFDIRQWFVVTSVDPLVIYGFSECYLRLSSTSFTLDDKQLSEPLVHLCNHAVQKFSDAQDSFSDDILYCNTMMTQSQFADELNCRYNRDVFNEVIKPQIKSVCINAVLAVRDRLLKVGNGFEWLGADLMIDEDLHVSLIEVNVSPDVSHSTPVTSRLVKYGVTDLLNLILDESAASIGISTSNEFRIDSSTTTAETIPRWVMWCHDTEKWSSLQFARNKREKAILLKDYRPSKTHYADDVWTCLQSLNTNKISDCLDEDEI